MKTQLGSFKGNPTITLNPGAKYPFSFGADKARMIVECFEEIKQFAAANPAKAKSKLVVSLINGVWYAEETIEPRRSQLIKLMGAAVLPTAYTAGMQGAEVKAKLQENNPGAEIVFFDPSTAPKYAAGPRNNVGQGS